MKAENLDVLVRDLIESLGVPDRKGVPLHLLIAEAKAFAKQKTEDHDRYTAKLEGDVETFIKSETELGRQLKEALDHLTAVQKDREAVSLELSVAKNASKAQGDLIRELRKDLEAFERSDRTAADSLMHSHMMWMAERSGLEHQIVFWKRFAADLVSGHATRRVMKVGGDDLDYINTLFRRRDSLPKDHKDYKELCEILAPVERAMEEGR